MNETTTTSRLRRLRPLLWALAAGLALLLAGALLWQAAAPDRLPAPTYTGEADIQSDFTLVDHTGRRVTKTDYAGRWQLVFFGFTNCPEVCSTMLAYMGSVLDDLGATADQAASPEPRFLDRLIGLFK